jgi:hypothetical protein
MNLLRMINIATIGWRTAVPPDERLAVIEQVETWAREQRELALVQQRGQGGPGVHRARGEER